jgi:hypothetical protein
MFFLVDSLYYNLLSVSHLCKMGYNYLFTDVGVTVFRRSDDSITFKAVLDGQLYLVDFNDNQAELDTCLIAKTNLGWLWNGRLAHVGMKNLHKLLKGEHILGLTNVHFEKDRICSACQAGKKVGVHHPHKNIMTTDRPFELLHMDPKSLHKHKINRHLPCKHLHPLNKRIKIKKMKMKIKTMSHLKRGTLIKGEMKTIMTRKMIKKLGIKDRHTQESTKHVGDHN